MEIGAQAGTFKGFFLVRDSTGKPKFDDIFNIAPEFWNELTKAEQETILQERILWQLRTAPQQEHH